mmetsp:Transcript_31457/g.74780  ORF Transcript_31457/g.74780 Transcript_31457/m.74780 type:complete len:235 (+) Transcript_31457:380-1084(+)
MLGYSFDETDESPVDESESPETRDAADPRAAPPRDATRLRGRLRLPKDTARRGGRCSVLPMEAASCSTLLPSSSAVRARPLTEPRVVLVLSVRAMHDALLEVFSRRRRACSSCFSTCNLASDRSSLASRWHSTPTSIEAISFSGKPKRSRSLYSSIFKSSGLKSRSSPSMIAEKSAAVTPSWSLASAIERLIRRCRRRKMSSVPRLASSSHSPREDGAQNSESGTETSLPQVVL